jgi:antitoxin VapB
MTKPVTAKLFKNGRSQAVRLPKEFRFEGKEVRISRLGKGVLLEPEKDAPDVKAWFAEIDRLRPGDFMKEGRNQPKMQRRKKMFK